MLTVDYDRLGLQPGELVLDLGCGFGRHAYEVLRRGARVVACDMAIPELREVRNTYAAMVDAGEIDADAGATASAGDATRLPFPDHTFDRIIASEVLEHVPDDHAAMAELTRVLKPGGVLAATVPAFLPERICWALSDDYRANRYHKPGDEFSAAWDLSGALADLALYHAIGLELANSGAWPNWYEGNEFRATRDASRAAR